MKCKRNGGSLLGRFISATMAAAIVLIQSAGCSSTSDAPAEAKRSGARPPGRPNVVFIMMDDMAYGDIGSHGNPEVETPSIDRLRDQSTRLTRFYAQPVCTPTRACLMTGRYQYRTRAFDTLYRSRIDPDEVTLAEVFRAAGYRTGLFGKWHLGDNYPSRPIDQGFDVAIRHLGGGMAHWFDRPGSAYHDPVLDHNGRSKKHRGYCDDVFFDEARRFINDNREQPFFCYVATVLPHDPLIPPSVKSWLPIHERGVNEENAIIYAMMKNADKNIGRLLGEIEKAGLADDTIVMFSSDNGPAMLLSEHQLRYNAGLRGEKKQTYEGGIRVPLFVRWPGKVTAGRDIERIGSMIDVLPTLVEACGIDGPHGVQLDGQSLWPLISGNAAAEQWPDRTLFFQHQSTARPEPYLKSAVRTQRWKLVDGKELYDLEADIAEANDVAAANPSVVSDLRARYDAWFADVSSTRGFEPTRIQLGTPHENPTRLNPRDWTLEAPTGKELMGHWPVHVAQGGDYRVRVHLKERQRGSGAVHVQYGESLLTLPVSGDGKYLEFPRLSLPAGPGKLKIWHTAPEKPPAGVAEVFVERI